MAQHAPGGEPLHSAFAGDPDMHAMIDLFVGEMPDRVAAIVDSWRDERLEDLQRIAHQLKGAAGGYGFESITQAASRVEEAINAHRDAAELRADVDALVDLCRRATA